ncbi:MFS transporter [Actinomycetota bacterium]|nr:MFS transporter [Actinomycetota bacterium]
MTDKNISNNLGQVGKQPAQSYVVMALIVVLAGIFASLTECKVPSILVPLSEQFGMDVTTGSLMMSVFTFMGIFFSIPASEVIARLGAKRVLINSAFVMVAGSLLGTFAPNAVVLIISRAIEGIALISTTIAGVTFIQNSAPPDRMGTAIGIWSAWFALGSFSAGVISPMIYEALGFQALWLIYAALVAIAAASIRLFVKAPNVIVGAYAGSSSGSATVNPAATAKPRYRELLKRDVIMILLVFAFYNLLSLAVVSYVPTILQMQGYDASLSGFITTLPMLISIVSALLLGILSDKLGRVKILLSVTFLVFAITSSLMFITTGPQIWIVAIIGGTFGNSAASLLMVSYLLVLPRPQLVPLAVGLFSTMQGLGQFLGSFLLPFLLGSELDNWYLAAGALFAIGILGFAASVIAKYR